MAAIKPTNEVNQDLPDNVEEAIASMHGTDYHLCLYIAGGKINSRQALKRLEAIFEEYLPGRYQLEVIDIYRQPERLQPDNIVAIPTLIKYLPLPLRRVIGDMSNKEKVLLGLDIVPEHNG